MQNSDIRQFVDDITDTTTIRKSLDKPMSNYYYYWYGSVRLECMRAANLAIWLIAMPMACSRTHENGIALTLVVTFQ